MAKESMVESVIGGQWVLFCTRCFLVKPLSMLSHLSEPMAKSWIIKMPWNFQKKSRSAKLQRVLFVLFLLTGKLEFSKYFIEKNRMIMVYT